MKKPLLPILLLLILPALAGATSQPNNSPEIYAEESETDFKPLPTPSWAEILPVDPVTAQILGEEIDASLKASWNEGYKAARVEYEPQVDYWMAIAQAPDPDRFWDGFLWGAAPSTLGGMVLGACLVISFFQVVR